ncbi:MAG: N-formylglutamate amidohydrolase [Nitriliruptoraceae bacterium]
MGTSTDDPPSFVVLPPEQGDAPIVVHVPHSATSLPDDVRAALLLTEAELAEELRRMTDHRTEQLASDVGRHGATRMVNRWSRLAVDPERFLDPAEEEMDAVGMGAVYTRTSDGRPLRDPTPAHRADLLDRHFHPYHAALTDLVGEHLERHGRCVLVDLHSYPRRALPYELHATGPRPEVDIGTDPRHTPAWLRDLVVGVVRETGLEHAENSPFAGTFVPTRYLGDPRVGSVMLELRRDTYLDEATARPHEGEARIRGLVTAVVVGITDVLGQDRHR